MNTALSLSARKLARKGEPKGRGVAPERPPPTLKRYRVLCAVTRAEWYEIDAPDEATALHDAFTDGELSETGDTTDVTEIEAEEVKP